MTRTIISIAFLSSAIPLFAEWKDLFNGKDLTGWSGDPRLWRVEDGVLIGETNNADKKIGSNSFLIWQGGEVGDFELEYKAKVVGNNSGVQYRSKVVDAAKWSVGGYQMDLHPNAPYLGMLYEERGRGIACQRGQRVKLNDKPQEVAKLEVPAVDLAVWNSYRIVATGNLVKHFVNGQLAAEIEDIHPEKRSLKGVLALQVHAGAPMKTEFKEIRLQEKAAAGEAKPGAAKAKPQGKQLARSTKPSWIWKSNQPGPSEKVFFCKDFEVPTTIMTASVTVSCDNRHHLYINGKDIGMGGEWSHPPTYDVSAHLKPGALNRIAIEGVNEGATAGLAVKIVLTHKNGRSLHIVSDESWQCSNEAGDGWQQSVSTTSAWPNAVAIGKMGDGPWGDVMGPSAAEAGIAEDMTDSYQVAKGFKLERIYQIPTTQGSWVSITLDGKGKLLCSDQYGKIYRVKLADESNNVTTATPLEIPLKGAHGLLWHEGVLWVCINEGSDQSGVWRVTDTNGDGEPDKPELVKAFRGRGEHGPHSLILAPDKKSIYVIAGNHTDVAETDTSLATKAWAEDQLLPRRPDARGHARDRMAPGGWIARFTPDGKNWQLFSVGYRNQFDGAFNEHGDFFTYDADMEWDLGMPWYRPTRINHVTPGSEFGWRNGTGKWPDYYEDSMPTQLDIGPGSPTGVVSGKGAKFPAKYQSALYALDWTFATLYAIHLTPDGAGYKAEREEFVAGKGLPLTDATIGVDGNMYFLTGGRRTESALWRVTYVGNESTTPVPYRAKPLGLMELADAKSSLGSSDRIARFNARTALEQAGPEALRSILKEPGADAWRILGASIAMARVGNPADAAEALSALDRLDWAAIDSHQKINWLRAAGLVFARHGKPDESARTKVLAKIDSSFPAKDAMLNRELCRMLSYLNAPGIVARTLNLMDSAGPEPAPDWLALAERNAGYGRAIKSMIENLPPAQVIHYVYCLRVVPGPWRGDERKRFFTWINKLTGNEGGASYGGFIEDLRKQTLATCTPEELELIKTFDTRIPVNPFANLPPVKGPGREWTIDEVVKLAEGGLESRDKKRGHDMFRASLCAACHRFGNEGGSAGPDLSSLSGRFTVRDLAESIIEPGKVVSDQYAFDLITRADGTEVNGKVIEEKDEKWIIATNPFDMSQTVEIERNDIKNIKPSPVSPMPPGMINRLNEEELKDMLAYLLGK
jgi:putative heme-binding domain-containing protein